MKPVVTIVVLIVFLAGGSVAGYLYLNRGAAEDAAPAPDPAEPRIVESTSSLHGHTLEIPDGAPICEVHRVPEMACPFHHPELVEQLGWCGGHDVAEALCSRCNPSLIAAFKAEGDWCAEHGLPESQCLTCRGGTDEG